MKGRFTREPQDLSFDVVVAGGGLAGVCAAIAAARHGCRTALVQDRPVLGGNSSSEIRVPPCGAATSNPSARETGIVEELLIEDRMRDHEPISSATMGSQWDLVLYEWVRREPNLTLYLNTSAREVEMDGPNRIAAVLAEQIGSELRLRFRAKLFIDCTGDATVGAAAGAEFRMGREARSEFGESLAPEQADDKTQGSSIMFRARDMGRPVPFVPPEWAEKYPTEESLLKRSHGRFNKREYAGYWWIEVGAPFDTIHQNEDIKHELLRHLLGVWDHIKNHGDHDAETLALDWIGWVPGKRESRRLIGDHILTENDERAHPLFPDRVAYGGWFIDVHTMGGILAKDLPPEALCGDLDHSDALCIEPYSIPFRCLYSKNIENLLMAGRNFSCTHIGLGSPRLMLTCAVMGQAVGTAAALCLKHSVVPRELGRRHIEELQQTLIKDDCFIPSLPNRDPNDLARGARAVATSEAELSLEPDGGAVPLEFWRSQVFPVTAEKIDNVRLRLRSAADSERTLEIALAPISSLWEYNETPPREPIVVRASVPPRFDGWLVVPLFADTVRGLYRLDVAPCPDVSWCTTALQPGIASFYRKPTWKRWRHSHVAFALQLDPPSRPYEAANVVNGVARPERWTNIWISDPAQPLPQTLTLEFESSVEFNTVYLTFDTNLHLDSTRLPALSAVPQCVRDYAIRAEVQGQWQTLVEVSGNYQRRRIHRFERVRAERIAIEVRATNGDPSARIYEVRVYDER